MSVALLRYRSPEQFSRFSPAQAGVHTCTRLTYYHSFARTSQAK
jgi:hypothetical protein